MRDLAAELGSLGYPRFAHLHADRKPDPAEFLLTALAERDLDVRVVEGLPWIILNYPDIDWDRLIYQARLSGLQNRLGYVVHLAHSLAHSNPARAAALAAVEQQLEEYLLANEDTLCENLTTAERVWLRRFRPSEAAKWNLLTGLTAQHLRYAA